MKNTLHKLFLLLIFPLAIPIVSSAQAPNSADLQYKVCKTYPLVTVHEDQLAEVNTLLDINERYKAEWVKEYTSVEISTLQNGEKQTAIGENEVLNQAQKDLLAQADVYESVSVKVRYLPDNDLKSNEEKEMNFDFVIAPQTDAQFFGGQAQMQQYLKETAIDKIPNGGFDAKVLAAVKFMVDETGKITQVEVAETSKNAEVDALLVEAVRNMPEWEPAQYANGTTIPQEYVLTVGNMESCVANTLKIRPQ